MEGDGLEVSCSGRNCCDFGFILLAESLCNIAALRGRAGLQPVVTAMVDMHLGREPALCRGLEPMQWVFILVFFPIHRGFWIILPHSFTELP